MKVPRENAAALARAVGQRIRTLRMATGLTQEKLAYESGLQSKGTLSKYESGSELPSPAMLELLAGRLGVELLDLFLTPDADHPRHRLIEATQALPPETLRAMLAVIVGPPAPLSPALPFTEVPPPRRKAVIPGVIPLLGLDVAAGGFDFAHVDRGTRWVKPLTVRRLPGESFVAKVIGRSMRPTIEDGAYVIFSSRVSPDPTNKIVLAQYGGLVDADTAASYTVKRFRGVRAPRGSEQRWSEIQLVPDNAAFDPITIKADRCADVRIVAELFEVLVPGASS